jgi:hypothetical protein
VHRGGFEYFLCHHHYHAWNGRNTPF